MIPETIARYRIVRPLGAGGMGEVYLAEDPALKRQVAIKVLPTPTASDETGSLRLVREAQAAATLDHPNVCAIYEVGEHDGRHFIAMQYVDGETLAERIRRGPLPVREAVQVAEQVADALSEAHAHAIIHRDVKPQNIMLTARGQVKVLDFGLAKVVSEHGAAVTDAETAQSLTEQGTISGTTAYMSPEQLRGERLDQRTDVFSLGCVVHEMVNGRRLFARESSAGTIAAVLNEHAPPLDARVAVPAELQRVVRKCLEKDRERRYQSARDLLVDLRNLGRDLSGFTAPSADVVLPRSRAPFGYLVAGLLVLGLLAATAGWFALGRSPGPSGVRALAILPFVADQASADYLGDGISDTLINSLSQLPQLKVMARTTTFRYKGAQPDWQAVRRDLNVDAIVSGRVVQQGDTLVVQADLTNAVDGTQIWGQRYSRKLVDLFSVQEEIAKEIATSLRLRLTEHEAAGLSKRYTDNIEAYRNYVLGRQFAQRRTPRDLQAAVGYYEQAIAQDARYALAFAGLTDAYTLLSSRGYLPLDEARRKARDAATTALTLDPDLAEAHAAVGQVHVYVAPYDFETGDRALRRAIELSPSWSIAHQYLGVSLHEQGRLDEALREWETAHNLDPLSGFVGHLLAYSHFLRRDFSRALGLQRQANQLGPAFSMFYEIEIYVQSGAFAEALAEIDRLTPGREDDPYLRYSRARLLAAQNRRAEALAIARQFEPTSATGVVFAHLAARIHLALGDVDRAFELMDQALKEGGIPIFYKDAPLWDPVRRDERFVRLLRGIGVSQDK